MRNRWYKDRVFYQIWPRSFKDGNGDGIGDLYGVLDKLDYIKSLGADGIWFSPLYVSPGIDCGYDIADYYNIDPMFGGNEAFDKVLAEAHRRDMKVIMDLVVNHTSDEHEWFQKSRQRIDPYTDYYIWRPGKPGGKLPNNWGSNFEGKAWTYDEVRGEYYLHLFAVKQPDLNMDNPLVREEVKKILRYWLDKGVDGFREDVITYISKPEGLPNSFPLPMCTGIFDYSHGPHLIEYLKEFREVLNEYDCFNIAESPIVKVRQALPYLEESEDNVFDMMIQFQSQCADCFLSDFFPMPFSLRKMKRAFSRWQNKLNGRAWNMLYIENHDHPRIVSRYGSEKYRVESAKMLCGMYMFQKGTPFIYQGQEIGMVNWHPDDPDMYEDIQSRNFKTNWPKERRLKILQRASRDHARTPMQWTAGENAGFTTGKPWFYVNDNYKEINVQQQDSDPDSVLNFYRRAIALRKWLPAVRYGEYKEYNKLSSKVYIYTRTYEDSTLLIVCSFSEKEVEFKVPAGLDISEGEILLKNYNPDPQSLVLKPYEFRLYRF